MTREQAEQLAGECRAVADAARSLAAGCSAREWAQPPSAGAWSAADNLMHLTLASRSFVPRMGKTLRKLAEAGHRTDGPVRADWVGRFYAWALEPPVRVRMRAPRAFVPPAGAEAAEALPAFLAEQEHVLALVEQAIGLDLVARKVPTPISRWVRYNVYSAFCVLVAHERRHLWQAKQTVEVLRAGGVRT